MYEFLIFRAIICVFQIRKSDMYALIWKYENNAFWIATVEITVITQTETNITIMDTQ